MIEHMRWRPSWGEQVDADAQENRSIEMWGNIRRWGRPRPCPLCGGSGLVMAYGNMVPCPKCYRP